MGHAPGWTRSNSAKVDGKGTVVVPPLPLQTMKVNGAVEQSPPIMVNSETAFFNFN